MKTLILVRHAKSSWNHPGLGDFERPLNKRGKRDAPAMAARLAEQVSQPVTIVASPATRALTTAHVFAEAMAINTNQIITNRELYGAEVNEFLAIIHRLNETAETVLLVSHNPGITDLVNQLSGSSIGNLPTCSVCRIEFASNKWSDVTPLGGTLASYDYPKKFQELM